MQLQCLVIRKERWRGLIDGEPRFPEPLLWGEHLAFGWFLQLSAKLSANEPV
jgi:hypothetical protein